MHLSSTSMFHFLASVFQTNPSSSTAGMIVILFTCLFSGFIIAKNNIGASVTQMGFLGLSGNLWADRTLLTNFLLQGGKRCSPTNNTIGRQILQSRGLDFLGRMVLIFVSLTLVFDNVQYYIDTPQSYLLPGPVFSIVPESSSRLTRKALLQDFVNEVLEITELYEIKDALVGIPRVSCLTMEQLKRLSIAVELEANPSIIFMDEPTIGLDARDAAIIMRAVKKCLKLFTFVNA
ncbi:hypothetical protein CRG98_041707 [Punica granatum]|uniref:ABC transporter domain-containing protein n=1 Tax=Punica granatum TaxID=22663 RepID=A0A2I0I1W2_PUNGR|nr:hypothetical protein CRG98_041707 [Punica granatum]